MKKTQNTIKTKYGRTMAGFSKVSGITVQSNDYYDNLRQNGFSVDFTPSGVIIYKA